MKKFLPFFILIALFSCKPKVDYNAEVSETAGLKQKMKASGDQFFKIDSFKIAMYSESVDAYLKFITETLRDTISPEEANLLSNFKAVKKSFGKYNKAKKQVDRYYKYNLKQLENLEHDLKEGLIEEKDSAARYIQLEATASKNLSDIMDLNSQLIPIEMKRYDSLKPLIENFIRKINKGTIPPDLVKEGANNKKGEDDDD